MLLNMREYNTYMYTTSIPSYYSDHCLHIMQTKGSNTLLHEAIKSGSCPQPDGATVLDLLLSFYLTSGKQKFFEWQKARKLHENQGTQEQAWYIRAWPARDVDIMPYLHAVSKVLFPSRITDLMTDRRREWCQRFITACYNLPSSIVESVTCPKDYDPTRTSEYESLPEYVNVMLGFQAYKTVVTDKLPSALIVPMDLYKFRKIDGRVPAVDPFYPNRALMLHFKACKEARQKKAVPEMLSIALPVLLKLTALPSFDEWRGTAGKTHRYCREWSNQVLEQPFRKYGLFELSLDEEHHRINVKRLYNINPGANPDKADEIMEEVPDEE